MRKGPMLAHWRKLLGITIRRQWYMVVDMRGSAIAWCLLTPRRYVYKRFDKRVHRLEDMRHTLKLTTPADPLFG